ncbi:MAG: hypothetical protein NVSMB55_01210 [Mycobacteriales bacterium]
MCHHASFQVLPEPAWVPTARDFCRRTLSDWELPGLVDEAQVVVSELVTNGVLHARSPLELTLSVASNHLEIAVSDTSPDRPQVRPHRQDLHADLTLLTPNAGQPGSDDRDDPAFNAGDAGSVVGGRGLLLVDALAAEWGVEPGEACKSVWARMVANTGQRIPVCPCLSAGGRRLASGHSVVDSSAPATRSSF